MGTITALRADGVPIGEIPGKSSIPPAQPHRANHDLVKRPHR